MRPLRNAALAFAMAVAIGVPSARAQGPRGSLGGYGQGMGVSGPGMGGGPVVPYAGRFGGFMPSRMGGGAGDLSFQSRASSSMTAVRPSFRLPSMSTGMASSPLGMGRSASPSSLLGGSGMGPSMPGGVGASVMPPRIGYPFRQPPSLLSTSSGMGSSM